MVKQQVMAGIPKQLRLPLWKRLLLVTTLLLSGEPLAAIVSSQIAHANSITIISCNAGPGGHGGISEYGSTNGGYGGSGGDCIIDGAKGGTGGTSSGNGANGGDVFFRP